MAVSAQEASTGHEPLRPRRVALVLNARAGGAPGGDGAGSDLARQLAEAGEEPFLVPPDSGTLPERVAVAKASGAAIVAVAGGDGSLACAAAVLIGTEAALGVIPCGTMNLLAKDLGLDPADRDAAVAALLRGQARRIDAGRVNGEVFLCASMLGTPARLGRHREKGRRHGSVLLGWAGFVVAALRALYLNRSMRVVLTTDDGRVLARRTPSLTVTVNHLDDPARLFARKNLNGGELGVYLLKRQNAARQVWLLLRTLTSGGLRDPDIEVLTCRGLSVASPSSAAMHVLVDGELRLLRPPLNYSIEPGALRVVVP